MTKSKTIKLLIAIILLLIIDMGSKYFFYDLHMGQGIYMFQPSFNVGIARSISLPMVFTIIMSIISLGIFCFMYVRKYINMSIAAVLIAGTLGNLIDRLWLGGVRDFINIQIFNFPIFNLADVFLNIGILLFIIQEISTWKKK